MFKNTKLLLVILSLSPIYVQARGDFPTVVSPGTCIKTTGFPDSAIAATGVLRKSQGIWYFSIEVSGDNAPGTWQIKFAKNDIWTPLSPPITYDPPGGWAYIGASASKGLYTFEVVALRIKSPDGTNDGSIGTQCTASLTMKL